MKMMLRYLYFWFKYDYGQKYQAPKVQRDRGSNSWPPDHHITFHVTKTPALTTRPSVTLFICIMIRPANCMNHEMWTLCATLIYALSYGYTWPLWWQWTRDLNVLVLYPPAGCWLGTFATIVPLFTWRSNLWLGKCLLDDQSNHKIHV